MWAVSFCFGGLGTCVLLSEAASASEMEETEIIDASVSLPLFISG